MLVGWGLGLEERPGIVVLAAVPVKWRTIIESQTKVIMHYNTKNKMSLIKSTMFSANLNSYRLESANHSEDIMQSSTFWSIS